MAEASTGLPVRPAAAADVSCLEPLSPEGSTYMLEDVSNTDVGYHSNDSNPITTTTTAGCKLVVLGVPSKSSDVPVDLPTGEVLDLPSSEEEERSSQEVLRDAGVELDLCDLLPAEGGGAPLELLSQCVSSMMREEFQAARILCHKVLEFEPDNSTVQQLQPLIEERLQQLDAFSTESSSENTSASSSSSASVTDSEDGSDDISEYDSGGNPSNHPHDN